MRKAGQVTLVIGGSGLLGRALVQRLTAGSATIHAPTRAELDLLDPGRLADALGRLAPGLTINAAAFTDVAGAERPEHRAELYALNHAVPATLARVCRDLDCRLIHLSTDYVFDGRKQQPYTEQDPVGPLQEYGRSKLAGERAVLDANPDALIVRTSTLYGPTTRGRLHYVDAILQQARAGAALSVVKLPLSSPTYAPDLAQAIIELAATAATGLVHVVNDGGCSRLELAREVVRLAGLASAVGERPEPAGSLARPAYSVLDTTRHAALVGHRLRPWDAALRDYVTGVP